MDWPDPRVGGGMTDENTHNKRYRLIMVGYFADLYQIEKNGEVHGSWPLAKVPAPPSTTFLSNTIRQLLTKRKNSS